MSRILNRPVQYLPTVGEKRAELLRKELNISTFGDLLFHFPIRYIDRSKIYTIAEVDSGSMPYVQIKARVQNIRSAGQGPKMRLVVEVADSTSVAELVWFRSINWVQKQLETEREYVFFGKPVMFNGMVSIVHPEFELPNAQGTSFAMGVQGVYRTTETLSGSMLGTRAIAQLLRTMWGIVEDQIEETLPYYLIAMHNLMSRREAFRQAHFPSSPELLSKALYRLKFEELFSIQLNLLMQKKVRTEQSEGFVFSHVGEKFNNFYNNALPFQLTGAQKRVVKEVREDMRGGRQMNRLLQGDVGSGKTVVALLCMLIAADNGYQSAIMAPTEILANQHYESIRRLTETLDVRVELLTGSTRKKKREEIAERLATGDIDILIGTHALIEDNVQFPKLGFVVIDEQHRFGVMQRAKLWTKNLVPPHVLVMTATPIPRTLAMTLYGDLDVSVIDELPPGRKQIRTTHAFENQRLRVSGFMREQIETGRQVYVVYPMIKESEKMDIANLEQGVEALAGFFPPDKYCTMVVHGKMPPKLKDYGMNTFKEGTAKILVSTTVIEVGVDVPNATVMVIESAERFGLSQLHQLRGRVGRGGDQSYCILMSGDKLSPEARKRLEAMVSTTDGFELAELDLKLRGAGDIEGTRQSGQAIEIKVANLSKDGEILATARAEAEKILGNDPGLDHPSNYLLRVMILRMKPETPDLDDLDISQIS